MGRFLFPLVLLALSVALAVGSPHPHPPKDLVGATMAKSLLPGSPRDAPTVADFNSRMGPPGQWLYVSGSGFEPGNTTLYFTSVSGREVVLGPIPAYVYQQNSLGFTIPKDSPATFVRLQAVTPYGKSEPSTDVFAIGVPINPPSVNGFSSYSGGTDCWLYVNGENFFVGQTEVHVGGVLPTSVAVYDSQSIGLTVPTILECAKGPLTVSVKTPNGQATSTKTYTVLPNKTGGFC